MISVRGIACGCSVVGTSMNFGFSGPIAETGDVVLKDRIGIEVRHRESAVSELLGTEGGMMTGRAIQEAKL